MAWLEFKQVTKQIGSECVLKQVSFAVDKGEVVALVGENGSGKTMALRAALGLIVPDSGEVIINNRVLGTRDFEIAPGVGILIEAPAVLPQLSAKKQLRLLAKIQGIVTDKEIDSLLCRVGLDPSLKKPVRSYSLGMKQRLGIAMAYMEAQEMLLLDEPTNALDVDGLEMLKNLILEAKDRGLAVIVSSHDRSFIDEIADKIYELRLGEIVGKSRL